MKPIQLNRIVFFALVFLAFLGVAFLALIAYTLLRPIEPHSHSHPHPHPHDTSRRNTADPSQLTYQAMVAPFEPALALKDTDPGLANARMHDIARELGKGDPDRTEFFHLAGHLRLKGRQPVDEALRYYELKEKIFGLSALNQELLQELRAMVQWNTERHEVLRRTEPIRLLLSWMEENAPAEWNVVNQRYQEVLTPLNPPPGQVIENWRTIPQRVDDHYDSLFQGLELLPDDALTLQEFFGSSYEDAQESLLSEQAALQAEPPAEPIPTPMHTWDSPHDTPVPTVTEVFLVQPLDKEDIGTLSGIESGTESGIETEEDFQKN